MIVEILFFAFVFVTGAVGLIVALTEKGRGLSDIAFRRLSLALMLAVILLVAAGIARLVEWAL